jgi:hypothetical protein
VNSYLRRVDVGPVPNNPDLPPILYRAPVRIASSGSLFIPTHEEDDRCHPARGLCCEGRVDIVRRKNRGNATADQIVRQRWQPIEMIFRRPILEGGILSLDMTGFTQAATKLGKFVTEGIEWNATKQADHWQRWPRCAHGER